MNKKVFKILFVFLLMFAINVKADYTFSGVDIDYTSVYRGDKINFSLGNDYVWDHSIVISNYDEDEDKYEYVKTEEGKYLAEPIFVIVDNDAFEIDITDNKVPNSNYIFADYKSTTDGNKNIYEFDFELNDLKEINENEYDGKIDNILVKNLVLKVKDEAEYGTYFIEVLRTSDFEEDYNDEDRVRSLLPITIIDDESKEDSISEIEVSSNSNGISGSISKVVEATKDKNSYELLFFNDTIDYTNVICNSKCKVTHIGNDAYIEDEAKSYNYKVTYESGKSEKYTVTNLLDKANIKCPWLMDFSKSVIIVGKDLGNTDELINSIASSVANYEDGFEKFVYDYNGLNDTDKELLKYLKDDFGELEEPYIFVVEDNKIVYEHQGYLEDEELSNLSKEIIKNKNGVEKVDETISSCDNGTCNINEENEEFNIKDYYMYIVIILSIIVIILILVITMIKKNKKETMEF